MRWMTKRRMLMTRLVENSILLRENFYSSGHEWADDAILYLSDGDRIEVKINTGSCYDNKETILSIGQNIDSYFDKIGARYYLYYTKSSRTLTVRVMYARIEGSSTSIVYSTKDTSIVLPSGNDDLFILIDKKGLTVNGSLVDFLESGSRAWAYSAVISAFNSSGFHVQIGCKPFSANSNAAAYTDGHATYNSIKLILGSSAPSSFEIVESISNAELEDASPTIPRGSSLNCSIAPDNGYTIDSVTLAMGGIDVTQEFYTNGNINIPHVFGNVTLNGEASISGTKVYHSVSLAGSHISFTNRNNKVLANSSYSCAVSADIGYRISQISVSMGGVDITNDAVNSNVINIPDASGDISITAVAEHETVLRQNFSPSGTGWVDETVTSFVYGDRIEALIDVSTCTTAKENIFCAGTNISEWTGDNGTGDRYMLFYTPSTRLLRLWAIYMYYNSNNEKKYGANSVDTTLESGLSEVSVVIDHSGFYLNGVLITGTSAYTWGHVRDAFYSKDFSVEIGSVQGDVRSRAGYEYIKVVRG